ncbi:hypothetical protein Rmet_6596 [Cupriavidus metallidurans CH34]|uniref:Uncharacterized protein n=1 Tax=Cupriavidus metallidurans (strain ATCC 43123 / DSM 2839 / NBRC 102507 / CH34) TaxID=266264 RepID=D3DY27_CUPMC|nr:hypothetical protein Rmet_6596 [Cupriavidus metallidurans CH34]
MPGYAISVAIEHGLKVSGSSNQEKYRCDEWCVARRETLKMWMNGRDCLTERCLPFGTARRRGYPRAPLRAHGG